MKVLCQNCLRVRSFTVRRHQGIDRCFCGGEFCGCDDCQRVSRLLKKRVRDGQELGLILDVIEKWTSKRGIQFYD